MCRLGPVNDFSELRKHLDLQREGSHPVTARTPAASPGRVESGLTPERMTSPDSCMAPSLLSLYTTASFISASSSSRQFGLQAPTAAGCKRDGERREDHAPPLPLPPCPSPPLTCHVRSRFHPPTEEHRLRAPGDRHYGVGPPDRLLHRDARPHRTPDGAAEPLRSLAGAAPHAHLLGNENNRMSEDGGGRPGQQ